MPPKPAPPSPPPEAWLIERARKQHQPKMPVRIAAQRAGLSPSRFKQLTQGYESTRDGPKAVTARAAVLANMAAAVGVRPEELDEAGRADAAAVLRDADQQIPATAYDLSDIPDEVILNEAAKRITRARRQLRNAQGAD